MTHNASLPKTSQPGTALPEAASGQNLRELVDQIRQLELDPQFGDLPEEKRVALRRTIEEALSILKKEENRRQAEKPAGSIAPSGGRFYRNTLSTALLLTRTVRFLISRTLGLSAMVFLVHFSLQFFSHPAKWDQWGWVVRLNDLLAPILARLDAVLEWPEATPFYPLVLALAVMVLSIMVDSKLTKVCAWVRETRDSNARRQAGQPHGGSSAINWLGASPYAAPPLGRAALAVRDPHSSW